jgi:hypothetical protein
VYVLHFPLLARGPVRRRLAARWGVEAADFMYPYVHVRIYMSTLLASGLRATSTICVRACIYYRWLTLTEQRLLVSLDKIGQGEAIRDDMMLLDIDLVAEVESDML